MLFLAERFGNSDSRSKPVRHRGRCLAEVAQASGERQSLAHLPVVLGITRHSPLLKRNDAVPKGLGIRGGLAAR